MMLSAACSPLVSRLACLSLITSLCFACSDTGGSPGSLDVLLEAEDTIRDGLSAGSDVEELRDGWNVAYDKYVVVIGDVRLERAAGGDEVHEHDLYAIDLMRAQSSTSLWAFDELQADRWDFYFELGAGDEDTRRHESVSSDDFERVVDDHLTYWITGTLSQEEGVSCPPSAHASVPEGTEPSTRRPSAGSTSDPCYDNPTLEFEWPIEAETVFGPCSIDDLPGVSVPEGARNSVSITLHGDHPFFNGFPASDEGGVERLAQWLADCDLDLDGKVTQAELEQVQVADLPAMDERYHWEGPPIAVRTAWDYVRAQLKTQGHMDGEGECEIDGIEADHDH